MADQTHTQTRPDSHSRRAALAGIAGSLAAATAAVAGVTVSTVVEPGVERPKHLASTLEMLAAGSFEAVEVGSLLHEIDDPHVQTWMIAAMILSLDKAKLVDAMPKLLNVHGNEFGFLNDFEESRQFFAFLAESCYAAKLRVVSAYAVIELNEGAQS